MLRHCPGRCASWINLMIGFVSVACTTVSTTVTTSAARGGDVGVTADDAADAAPVPTLFVAVTVNV